MEGIEIFANGKNGKPVEVRPEVRLPLAGDYYRFVGYVMYHTMPDPMPLSILPPWPVESSRAA